MRDWDAYNNSEPFWTAMHGLDLEATLVASGFNPEDIFRAGLKGVVDNTPVDAGERANQDHGRAAAWHTYGAWSCLLYTSPSPRDLSTSRMPSSA